MDKKIKVELEEFLIYKQTIAEQAAFEKKKKIGKRIKNEEFHTMAFVLRLTVFWMEVAEKYGLDKKKSYVIDQKGYIQIKNGGD